MVAGLVGVMGVSLYLALGYLCAARFLDSWHGPVLYTLIGAQVALFLYWIVRLVLAVRHKNRQALLFLGIEFALALGGNVFLYVSEAPLVYRVKASQAALEQAALSAPQGSSKTPRTIGTFPVVNITRIDNAVYFECWKTLFGVEGIVYTPKSSVPARTISPCRFERLTGNWYLWHEDQFQ